MNWLFSKQFPYHPQSESADCGPTCLKMICEYYGKQYDLPYLRKLCHITRDGVSMQGINSAAERVGLKTIGVKITIDKLDNDMPLPCILHWRKHHFVVCFGITKKKGKYIYKIADPALGIVKCSDSDLKLNWLSANDGDLQYGFALALVPTVNFPIDEDSQCTTPISGKKFFWSYLSPYKTHLLQLVFALLIISGLQLCFPFLTQSLVDFGIKGKDSNIILMILVAQLFVSSTQLLTDFIRSWVFLNMNTRINIALISDFLSKLMRLPIQFFEMRLMGDILQRIRDHKRIEMFMTGSTITTFFSFFTIIVFACILYYYSPTILLVFLIGNSLYLIWVFAFMSYRRKLDTKFFTQSSIEQSNLIQIVEALPDIKLNSIENQKRWEWENVQATMFRLKTKSLTINQYQKIGSLFFNQTTNILIWYMAANMVVTDSMTLGMMMAMTYIIGQLNTPINSTISFIQQYQDAKMSLERLKEVHLEPDEIQAEMNCLAPSLKAGSIIFNNVCFSYDGMDDSLVLRDINLTIPLGKKIAIVGKSGCGKTTLLKLLLGFYPVNSGSIRINGVDLMNLDLRSLRSILGVVMQDGYIYSDTILNNIVLGNQDIDNDHFLECVQLANVQEFVSRLPLQYNTKIGQDGGGLSQGQKQRILIARALYKNPELICFDEATNALDARNENDIMKNLFRINETSMIIIAHRLSTIKNADLIVVMDKGQIVETGTHKQLLGNRGCYSDLISSQLEYA